MWELPTSGDIVWRHFPQRPRDVTGPKPRPALVVSVTEYEDGHTVRVAYGTSQKVDRLNAGEFAIRKAENKTAYEVAGLSYDTKFDLCNMVELPWNERFITVPPNPSHGQTPKLGSLHIGMHRALNAAAHITSCVVLFSLRKRRFNPFVGSLSNHERIKWTAINSLQKPFDKLRANG